MTHRFILFSQEVKNFVIEIKASPQSTFRQLHDIIQSHCQYVESGNHHFLICDEDWHVHHKVYLRPKTTGYDEDLYLMDETPLEDFIDSEGQHIAYVYDVEGKRNFLIELVENIYGQSIDGAIVSRSKGTAPEQFIIEELDDLFTPTPTPTPSPLDEDDAPEDSDEDSYDADELDMEGFEVSQQ